MSLATTRLVLSCVVTVAAQQTTRPVAEPHQERRPEATSLLGKPLYAMELDAEVRTERQARLEEAEKQFAAEPTEDNLIWVGRRLAYLGRYNDAIATFTEGLERFPESSKLRRHRGHRYITVRRLDDAIADLAEAAALVEGRPDEVEPDGQPNDQGKPRSTSHTNIYYHLGLAHYLQGDFENAARAYASCLEHCRNDDMLCATTYWLYLSRRRLGLDDEAAELLEPIARHMDVIENHAYHRLLLLFKGELSAREVGAALAGGDEAQQAAIADATTAYGLAMWTRLRGDEASARRQFGAIVAGPAWPAFGYVAAEAELAREMRKR